MLGFFEWYPTLRKLLLLIAVAVVVVVILWILTEHFPSPWV